MIENLFFYGYGVINHLNFLVPIVHFVTPEFMLSPIRVPNVLNQLLVKCHFEAAFLLVNWLNWT